MNLNSTHCSSLTHLKLTFEDMICSQTLFRAFSTPICSAFKISLFTLEILFDDDVKEVKRGTLQFGKSLVCCMLCMSWKDKEGGLKMLFYNIYLKDLPE